MDAALINIKIPDVSMIDVFKGSFFKRWQERVFYVLDVMNLADYLTKPKPEEGIENYDNLVTAVEIWEILNKKYVTEDAGTQKYAIGNFLNFQMVEGKDVSLQIHEFHKVANHLKNEDIQLPEAFVSGSLIEKLPDSWKDYKNNMKHKKKQMSLEDVVVHIRIEEKNRMEDKADHAKKIVTKANVIEEVVSEVSVVTSAKDWVIDSGATRHICGNRSALTSFTPVQEGEEHVLMGDSRRSPVVGKEKVLIKLISGFWSNTIKLSRNKEKKGKIAKED